MIVAKRQKNIEAMSPAETARYSVCILFHMISGVFNGRTNVGKFKIKN
jgi:hypothetical protein